VLRGRQKLKKATIDRPSPVNISPDDPAFEGRLLAEINSAYGPKKLLKILQDHGRFLNTDHLSMAISILAGTAHNKQLDEAQQALYSQAARECIWLLTPQAQRCSHLAFARAAYGLARLGFYDPDLFSALVEHSREQLMTFTGESFSGLLTGLAMCGHQPGQRWLERYCLEVYSRLSRFDAQQLAAMVYAMGRLGHQPSAIWVDSCMRRLRTCYGSSCRAPSMVKFLHGLVKLGTRPDFNWSTAFLAELRSKVDFLTTKELATVLWALAKVRHRPDLIFLEVWYKSAAKRAGSWQGEHIVLALQALAALGAAPVNGRFLNVMLPQLPQLMPALQPDELASVLWALAALRAKPEAAWMADFMAGEAGP
jgi:hypothetical protein